MIVDLVRNDLGRVCATGSVTVPAALRSRALPGPGPSRLHGPRRTAQTGAGWPDLLDGQLPAWLGHRRAQVQRPADHRRTGDVRPRGPYCGGIGWVDADRGTGELAVGIRTFWIDRAADRRSRCCASAPEPASPGAPTPRREWDETELKASRLLAVASGAYERCRSRRTTP